MEVRKKAHPPFLPEKDHLNAIFIWEGAFIIEKQAKLDATLTDQ